MVWLSQLHYYYGKQPNWQSDIFTFSLFAISPTFLGLTLSFRLILNATAQGSLPLTKDAFNSSSNIRSMLQILVDSLSIFLSNLID